jgi:tetratricopeptide (TPR) repeat protein
VYEEKLLTLRAVAGTFRFGAPPKQIKTQARIAALAARCGREIEWIDDWKSAAGKAKRERRLILVMVRNISGFQLGNSFMTGPFTDPDVVKLVKHRFVALDFRKGMGAPFESHEVYGLGPSTFGTTILLTTPGGRVVGDTFCYEISSFLDLLVETLAENRRICSVAPPEDKSGADLARWLLSRGEHERAAALLASPKTREEHLLKASLFRRMRKGEEALEELESARSIPGSESLAELSVDEAVTYLRMGRPGEAYSCLRAALNRNPDLVRKGEALYWLGACTFRLAGAEGARKVWEELVEAHPESPWAWKAAATLKGAAFSLSVLERHAWPSEEILPILSLPEPGPLPCGQRDRAQRDALDFLLANQRRDGSWISPAEVAKPSSRIPHEFTVAATALAGLGLLPQRKDPRVSRALHRALGFILQAREVERVVGNRIYFMDYSVWSKTYTLWFFARSVEAGLIARETLETEMEKLVEELGEKQKSGGGWSYYVTRDLENLGRPSEQSISFITAAVLLALREAREAGIEIPRKISSRGISCMERMANEDSTFEYMLNHGNELARRKPNLEGAAGRGPLCALTLYRWGRGSLDSIRKTLRIFAAHRELYAREKRKSLMHTGLGSQGSHYLMFDYANAALALSHLSPEERMVFRGVLLGLVLDARGTDGSYVDNPINGSHVGTALALIALNHLRENE